MGFSLLNENRMLTFKVIIQKSTLDASKISLSLPLA